MRLDTLVQFCNAVDAYGLDGSVVEAGEFKGPGPGFWITLRLPRAQYGALNEMCEEHGWTFYSNMDEQRLLSRFKILLEAYQ
jgi:hypothetical protein